MVQLETGVHSTRMYIYVSLLIDAYLRALENWPAIALWVGKASSRSQTLCLVLKQLSPEVRLYSPILSEGSWFCCLLTFPEPSRIPLTLS